MFLSDDSVGGVKPLAYITLVCLTSQYSSLKTDQSAFADRRANFLPNIISHIFNRFKHNFYIYPSLLHFEIKFSSEANMKESLGNLEY